MTETRRKNEHPPSERRRRCEAVVSVIEETLRGRELGMADVAKAEAVDEFDLQTQGPPCTKSSSDCGPDHPIVCQQLLVCSMTY